MIRVITGVEEARLIHIAAGYGVDVGSSRACVVDIGGGSVESRSAPRPGVAGAELQDRRDPADRTVREERSPWPPRRAPAREALNREMGGHLKEIASRGFDRVIGTSGTILSLGALALSEDGADVGELRNRRVSAKALRRLRQRILEADSESDSTCPAWTRVAPI